MWFFWLLSGSAFAVYFSEKPLQLVYALILTFTFFLIRTIFLTVESNRFAMISDINKKEFIKITNSLSNGKYNALLSYLLATGTSFEESNKFLNSPRGIVFLEKYKKLNFEDLEFSKITSLIVDCEREEHLMSCAIDILKSN